MKLKQNLSTSKERAFIKLAKASEKILLIFEAKISFSKSVLAQRCVKIQFIESLILAQDKRWRRA